MSIRHGLYLMYSGAAPGYRALAAYDPKKNTISVLTNLMWSPEGGTPRRYPPACATPNKDIQALP